MLMCLCLIGASRRITSSLMAHQKTEILAMLAAGRAGSEIARIFRVHRATISRVAAEARTESLKTEAAPHPLAAQLVAPPLASKS